MFIRKMGIAWKRRGKLFQRLRCFWFSLITVGRFVRILQKGSGRGILCEDSSHFYLQNDFAWFFPVSFLTFFSAMPDSFCKTAKSSFPLQLGFLPVNRDALAAECLWLSTMVHIITCV